MDDETFRRELVDDFWVEAQDDLVNLWQIVKRFEQRTSDPAVILEQSLLAVRDLLARGLVAGDPPYSATGYRPWPDQRPDAVIQRIRAEWQALGRLPNIPDIAWFDLPG